MILRQGDTGSAVKTLQRGLNRLGAMMLVDGDFGPQTGLAVDDARVVLGLAPSPDADDELQAAVAAVSDPFPLLTAAGVTFIARAEVTSSREYRRRYKHPIWPSAGSGITIGIGYDLSVVTAAELHEDWDPLLPIGAIDLLAKVTGRVGSAHALAQVEHVEVPLPAALTAFIQGSLPEYTTQTRSIYPELDTLSCARRSALVSLVYNRGWRLADRNPDTEDRREMREIKALLQGGAFDAVADQFDSMARLWNRQNLGGVVQRRHDEARLWRSGFSALQLE